ncbi:MAG: iron ABC transporter permease [Gammaproteobacteria bacterium]|jgi:iron complex transport system permease protein|nr:iron ABC transporter permease [Gammaproteobacteria bacterium]
MKPDHHWNLYKRPIAILIVLSCLAPASMVVALNLGSVSVDWLNILDGSANRVQQDVILQLRLPRTLSAFVTGGLLALAGVLMQVLLRNPLADPYILGISGGAAVAALLAMLAGLSGYAMTGSAFLGALLSMFLVFSIAHGQGSWTPTRLLLTGVVIAAGWGAIISFILSVSPEKNLHSMLFWLMGDLSYSPAPTSGAIILLLGLSLSGFYAKSLNIMARSEWIAESLGVAVSRLRIRIYLLASIITASAVTSAGSIAFVGLITPHLLRLSGVHDHRFLIPSAVMLGGVILVLADAVSRTLLAPQQLPVGVITAMIGVPLFLYLMHKSANSL